MRTAEGFVRIVVHQIGAEIAGPGDAQYGVHVRAVEINQPADVVDHFGDLGDLPVEQSQRVRIGDHEHGGFVVELARQIVEIDQTCRVAFHRQLR